MKTKVLKTIGVLFLLLFGFSIKASSYTCTILVFDKSSLPLIREEGKISPQDENLAIDRFTFPDLGWGCLCTRNNQYETKIHYFEYILKFYEMPLLLNNEEVYKRGAAKILIEHGFGSVNFNWSFLGYTEYYFDAPLGTDFYIKFEK